MRPLIAAAAAALALTLTGCSLNPFASESAPETMPDVVTIDVTSPAPAPQEPTGPSQAEIDQWAAAADAAPEQIREFARVNGLEIAEGTVAGWTRDIRDGYYTFEEVKDEITSIAIDLYPAFAGNLRDGQTLEEAVAPYAIAGATELTLVDPLPLDDPIMLKMLGFRDANGSPAKMNLDQFSRLVWQDERIKSTRAYRERLSEIAGYLVNGT